MVDRTGGAWVSPADPTGDYARWIHDTNSSITGKGKSVASNVHESIGVVMISANDAGQAVAVDGQGKLWLRQGIRHQRQRERHGLPTTMHVPWVSLFQCRWMRWALCG